jgi:hypothetical protein
MISHLVCDGTGPAFMPRAGLALRRAIGEPSPMVLGRMRNWRLVPIAATRPPADHRHHDHHLLDPAERRSLP